MFNMIATFSFDTVAFLLKDWFLIISVLLVLLKTLLEIIKKILLYFWKHIKNVANLIADLDQYEINTETDEWEKTKKFAEIIKDNWCKIIFYPMFSIALMVIVIVFSKSMITTWMLLSKGYDSSFFLPWVDNINIPDSYNIIGIMDGVIFVVLYSTILYQDKIHTIVMISIYILQTILFFHISVKYVILYCELETMGLFLFRSSRYQKMK